VTIAELRHHRQATSVDLQPQQKWSGCACISWVSWVDIESQWQSRPGHFTITACQLVTRTHTLIVEPAERSRHYPLRVSTSATFWLSRVKPHHGSSQPSQATSSDCKGKKVKEGNINPEGPCIHRLLSLCEVPPPSSISQNTASTACSCRLSFPLAVNYDNCSEFRRSIDATLWGRKLHDFPH
jgi:hypothetical protein